MHGFTDIENRHLLDRWHNRIVPFLVTIDKLLRVHTAGQAMFEMNKRYDVTNAILTSTYDRIQRRSGEWTWTPERRERFIDTWIVRGDAQNYMVFGDPAARLRIPEASA